MSDPSCRALRELLGVYVVGAIEPAERSLVDAHLHSCYECREELAGLAVLPALLNRVPAQEAEHLASADGEVGEAPSPAMLTSLLKRARATKRTRRLRSLFATAAAVLIAAGGAAAISQSLAPATPSASGFEVKTGHLGRDIVTVRYGPSKWGTTMWVRMSGFPQWTWCKFWVVTKDGQRVLAGGWMIGPGGSQIWYPVGVRVPTASVTGFVITTDRAVLRIPA